MCEIICLGKTYSTTKLLVKDKPIMKNKPKDKFENTLFLPENKNRKGEGGLRTKGYFKKSYDDKPLISIITVVYNGEKYLEQTIQSVINQTYDNVEYIIIDGGSTDGTLDIIKKYEGTIDYWVSEVDKGIYDAMNKGIILATGKIIGLINSDDWYELNTVDTIVDRFQKDNSIDLYHGDLLYYDHSSIKKYSPKFTYWRMLFLGMSLYHPTCFVRKEVYQESLFDIKYQLVADYKLIFSLMKKNKKTVYIPEVLANMRGGGAGTVFWKRIVEGNKIRRDLGIGIFLTCISSIIRISITVLSNMKKFVRQTRDGENTI